MGRRLMRDRARKRAGRKNGLPKRNARKAVKEENGSNALTTNADESRRAASAQAAQGKGAGLRFNLFEFESGKKKKTKGKTDASEAKNRLPKPHIGLRPDSFDVFTTLPKHLLRFGEAPHRAPPAVLSPSAWRSNEAARVRQGGAPRCEGFRAALRALQRRKPDRSIEPDQRKALLALPE